MESIIRQAANREKVRKMAKIQGTIGEQLQPNDNTTQLRADLMLYGTLLCNEY